MRLTPFRAQSHERLIIFRSPAMANEHVARFVLLFLGEMVRGAAHYDAVHRALDESGIQARPRHECKENHLETQIERVNWLADVLLAKIAEDKSVHASICAVSLAVLTELTIPAPADHPTDAQLQTYLSCCSASPRQLIDYDTYAERHAHIGACTQCERRLLELDTEPPT